MPRPISKSAHRRKDYYAFFVHSPTDRQSAISAIVAGSVAGGLMASVLLVAWGERLILGGWHHPDSTILLGAAILAAFSTYATWKHLVIGPVIGLTVSISLVGWLVARRGDIAVAALLAVPLVGGLLTAARGIRVLNELSQGAETADKSGGAP